jgi:Protein of unknown function (DUF3592)
VNAPQRPGWAMRLAAMLFSGLFMLAFGGGGLFFGVLPLLDTARQAWLVRTWVPVSAQVLEVQLDTHRGSKGGSTYLVKARYAYRYGGRDFEATRIGLDTWIGADNVGDWHQRWHHNLTDARAREQPVAAWIDPDSPARAVLERRPRWGLLLFRLPFALLFTAVGVGAAVMFVRALLGLPDPPKRVRSASPRAGMAASTARRAAAAQASALSDWPAMARGRLDDARGEVHFVRRWPRWLAAGLGVLLMVWLVPGAPGRGGGLPGLMLAALLGTGWAALVLHLATWRWRWARVGRQLRVDRGSWLVRREIFVDRHALQSLSDVLVFTSRTTGEPTVHHHRLVATVGGRPVALTPALPGPESARAVADHLRQVLGRAAAAG